MYVPPYESLLRALNADKSSVERSGKVTIPTRLLQLVLQIAVANSDFDDDAYLRTNLDVKGAVDRGELRPAICTILDLGILKGEEEGTFDTDWYLEANLAWPRRSSKG
ncbi:hypothetical protein ACH79_15950 [Bradyrhizobium sp. CCBAU 051011]|nr:hypothetical protein ACH79_15950 [Bradyrhizobium sp. CCBAU 051011]